jgi:hypothetical protein
MTLFQMEDDSAADALAQSRLSPTAKNADRQYRIAAPQSTPFVRISAAPPILTEDSHRPDIPVKN